MLDDRTCLVTGASRGIGRGIAEEFGAHGADVVVNYRSSEAEAYEAVDAIEDAGGSAIPVRADVADLDQVREMHETVREAFGPVDVLVNNAGVTVDKKFENMTREDW
ncbi:MAG: SDR family NAD(P)-dependent oxidoreductase, partial [Haloarculaceae archaeon]